MPNASSLARRPLNRGDVDSLVKMINASEEESPLPIVTTRNDVANEFDEPHQDLSADTVGVVDENGVLIAYVWTSLRADPTRERIAHIRGRVHPDWTRKGIASSLIEWAVGRCRDRLADHPDDLPKAIRSYVYEEDIPAVRAYEAQGFEPDRYFVELTRDLSIQSSSIDLPQEISITTWSPGIDERVRLAHNLAFLDHWGSEPLSATRWKRWLSGNEHFLPHASFVAVAGEDVIGYSMNMAHPEEWTTLGHSEGWIGALGTIRDWRKQGVASMLIEASIEAFRGLGYDQACLGVDTANPLGALGLYTRNGFTPTRREVSYSIAAVEPGN